MTRSFLPDPIDPALVDHLVALAQRSPSAGKTQGWHAVVLTGPETTLFWDATLPAERRSTFRWQGLLQAPVILLPLADASAYVTRYGEADKAATGLGTGVEAWPVPYWTIDTSMAMMSLLLGAEDLGLGALLFGVFRGEQQVRASLGIPDDLQLLGAIALGWPDDSAVSSGRSARRTTRPVAEVIHRGRW